MKFRTTFDIKPSDIKISHDTPVLLLGSCFTDNIGLRLEQDGFDAAHNPMGPIYNPASLLFILNRISQCRAFDRQDLTADPANPGHYHCLTFASKYQGNNPDMLLDKVNYDFGMLADSFHKAGILIITLGTSFVFKLMESGHVVGNCHKLPATMFKRELLTAEQSRSCVNAIARICAETGKHLVLTVSPIRHMSDGAVNNTLSKSRLIEAVHTVRLARPDTVDYFPAFELLYDDLRDYRFYAADMTHPSEVAIDYVYNSFSNTFFTRQTMDEAAKRHKAFLRSQHRPILS